MAREIPLISVIISTYNRPNTLKRAIKSVVNQTISNWELLVIDDCSPNASENESIVKSFNNPQIRYIKTENNFGHDGPVKNLGIKESKGDFICFLDDDDEYRPEALKILSTYIQESEADVVYGDYLITDTTKEGGKKEGWSVDFNVALLSRMNYISMIVAMISKKALLTVGGFDEEIPKFKDWNLWIRLQKSGHLFLHVPIIVANVYTYPESISSKYKVQYDSNGHYLPTFFNPADCKIYPNKTSLGERKKLKVAVYTLTWNRLEYTKMMVESITKTAGYDFDWFVIDQASTDGTVDYLKLLENDREIGSEGSLKKMVVQYNEKNVGLAQGWNEAIELIKKTGDYDIFIKIDNDAKMLTEGWLKAMVDIFESNSMFILSTYVEGLEKSPGGVLRSSMNSDTPYMILNDKVLGRVPNLGGICFATPARVFEEWKFDPGYKGNKDYLLSTSASRVGYSLFYLEEYRIWHIDGTSGQHEKFPEYFKDPSNDSAEK